jgi:folate-binding protein YgfZ
MSETPANWLDFLISEGAILSDGAIPEITRLEYGNHEPVPTDASHALFTSLCHLGVIALDGEEAEDFLHNQLTSDIHGLDQSHACLAGYCSPKGRLLASLLVWRDADRLYLACPLEILPAIQKRLQMFVLRSKVKLSNLSTSLVMLGLSKANPQLLGTFFTRLPELPYAKVDHAGQTLIRLPDVASSPRYLMIADLPSATSIWHQLKLSMQPAPTAWWRWTEIQAGTPQIQFATQEKFVPQMINFELIGGVNFRKGCYPGQEIVARSQYLGKLKRRMLLAHCEQQIHVHVKSGDEIFSEDEPTQPCGMVVNAECSPDGRIDCLIEIKLETLQQHLRLHSVNGPQLHLDTLPYTIPELE